MIRTLFAAALFATAAFAPAMAQDPATDTVGTLHVNSGQIMVSRNGGDFASVSSDTAIHVGDRIQVGDSSDANLVYNNGYVLHYVRPGVYEVQMAPAGTAVAGGAATAGSVVTTSAIVLGVAALAAAGLDQEDNVPPIDPAVSR
jgi:hypothetical protein